VKGEEDAVVEVRMKKASKPMVVSETTAQPSGTPLFPLSGGVILTPDGAPADSATIEISVKELLCGPSAKPVNSDDKGKFILSDDQHGMIGPQDFVVSITHASGAVVIDGKTFRSKHDREVNANAEPIRLLKWGRIEGTLQVGDKKLEGTSVAIRWAKSDAFSVSPSFYQGATTKKDGRFTMEQVMPGTISVTRSVYIPALGISGSWSSHCGTVEVKPGETTVCTVGGKGNIVIGRASVPETTDFSHYTARIVVKPDNLDDLISPTLPKEYWGDPWADDPSSCNIARLAWYQTDEGKKYQQQSERSSRAVRQLRFTVLQKEGTFRFDDLPVGDYAMVISSTDNCGMDFEAGEWHILTTFTVSGQPVDLGELILKRAER
jgi:hypothetical protein